MSTHVKVLAVIFLVYGALGVLAACAAPLFFGSLAAIVGASHDDDAHLGMAVLGLTGLAFAVFFFVTSIPGVICGWGLLKFRPWARILGIVLAAICLINIPLGTILGIYALWVFFHKDTEALFVRA